MMKRTALLVIVSLCAGTLLAAAVVRPPSEQAGAVRVKDAQASEARPPLPDPPPQRTVMPRSPRSGVIAAEALVFRRVSDRITLAAQARRRAGAHPRTLAGFRALRAYPGAPPRVPHGLTAEELRGSLCNTCHLRGGYSPRFGAYVPVTPHAELQNCLQCHPTSADLVELPAIGDRVDARCRQCHRPGAAVSHEALIDWRPASWPQLASPDPTGAPPAIPHDLALRGDCAACHAGPASVAEIRTAHPDRTNCRQCHLANFDDGEGGGP